MKTVFTYGGKNNYRPNKDGMIELRQSEDKNGRFILSYGCEVKTGLSYSRAEAISQFSEEHEGYKFSRGSK